MRIQSVEQNTNFQAKKVNKTTKRPHYTPEILRDIDRKLYGNNIFGDFGKAMRSPFGLHYIVGLLIPLAIPFLILAAIVKGCNSATHTGHGNCNTEKIHHCNCQNRQNDNFNEQDEKTLNLENRFKN